MFLKETLILVIAVIIPGGLIVYIAWKAYKAKRKKTVTPSEAVKAFKKHFPIRVKEHEERSKTTGVKPRNIR
jgi:hypothetical protein